MEIRPVGAELFHADERTDGKTDTTILTIAFSNFANASKNRCSCSHKCMQTQNGSRVTEHITEISAAQSLALRFEDSRFLISVRGPAILDLCLPKSSDFNLSARPGHPWPMSSEIFLNFSKKKKKKHCFSTPHDGPLPYPSQSIICSLFTLSMLWLKEGLKKNQKNQLIQTVD